MAASQWIQLDGLNMHYVTAGEGGSPVLLLHGGGTDSALLSWRLALDPLAQTHRVYAPDWPGYGQSSPLRGEYTTNALIECLGQFMDALGLERASLVGVSMGGGVALGYALAFPGRVERLVLVDSYGLQEQAPFHKLSYLFLRLPFLVRWTWASMRKSRRMTRWGVQAVFHNRKAVSDELVEEVFQAIQQSSAEAAFYAWQRHELLWSCLRTCYMDRLREVRAETLLVHGDHDALVPVARARQAAGRIPNAHLHIIAGCGHWPQREKPDEFNRVVAAFLSL